jgi:hypothetical protein
MEQHPHRRGRLPKMLLEVFVRSATPAPTSLRGREFATPPCHD